MKSNVKGYAGTVKAIAEEKFELEESGAAEAEVERAVHDMAKLMSEALVVGYAQMREDVDEALEMMKDGEFVEDDEVPAEVIWYAVEIMANEIRAAKVPAARLWEKTASGTSLLATLNGSVRMEVERMIADELKKVEGDEDEGSRYWSSLGKRARKGVRSFLTKKGYEIVEEDFKFREKKAFRADTIPFVAKNDGDLVFVEVSASTSSADFDEIEAGGMTRVDFEAAAFEFLRVSNLKDASVRFDSICVRFVADDRALIRHHIDCMEVA